LAGFVGKYNLWASLVSQYMQTDLVSWSENLLYILIISVFLSLLSTFYYLRLIKVALFDNFQSGEVPTLELNTSGVSIGSSLVLGTLALLMTSWLLLTYDLDLVWTRFVLGLIAPLSMPM
jgi:NADH:ubiquinone oxidoreductase subunit 2 (subunit N)